MHNISAKKLSATATTPHNQVSVQKALKKKYK